MRASASGSSIPAARAAGDDTGRTVSPAAAASARAVAIPMRRPVNVPGPTPTAMPSRSPKPTPARSITPVTAGISSAAWAGRSSSRSGEGRVSKASPSPRSTQALVAAVLVSKPSRLIRP